MRAAKEKWEEGVIYKESLGRLRENVKEEREKEMFITNELVIKRCVYSFIWKSDAAREKEGESYIY